LPGGVACAVLHHAHRRPSVDAGPGVIIPADTEDLTSYTKPMGYCTRDDIPFHFAPAENVTNL
jgi:hypothetical protein